MTVDIRFPNITATTESGKIQQLQSYMHQLVEQLNWALNTVETASNGTVPSTVNVQQAKELSPKEAEDTFNSIKALIIKSADIVKAYEKTIFTDFDGKYFADSDFGTYLEETSRAVEENSKGVTEYYERIETIDSRVEGVEDEVRTTNAHIRRGYLDDGAFGIEIGETKDGVFKRYARFTSDKLSFHDKNGNEVAYIGAGEEDKENPNCLYITGRAIFQGDIQFGQYIADTSDGLAFTWIGG